MAQNEMPKPWWLRDGDTGKSRKFPSFAKAKEAGLRAYAAHTRKGFDAKDKYFLQSQGETISVWAMAEKEYPGGSNMARQCGDYWQTIGEAIDELNEYGFITERTLERLREREIDPVQVELGWADIPENTPPRDVPKALLTKGIFYKV